MAVALAPGLAEAFDRFPDGLAVFEPLRDQAGAIEDFLCVYANPVTAQLSGQPVERLAGQRLLRVVPAFGELGVFDGYRQAIAGEPWAREVHVDAPVGDNHVRASFEMRAVPIGTGILATYRDVTTLRRGEEAMEHMTAIVASSEDAIVTADSEGRITHWNPAAERLFGHAQEAIVGESIRRLVRAEDLDEQMARFREVLGGRQVVRITTQWVRADRTLVDVLLTASPLRDRDGAVVGATAVVHDITEQRRNEAELRRANAELERFAAVAAHDLRAPVVTLLQLARFLGRVADDDRTREIAGHVQSAAEHACRLVDGIEEYARTATRPGAPPTLVDLDAIVRGLTTTLAPVVAESSARIDVGPLPTVLGDAGGLTRVLQNLLANALKYRREDAPPSIAIAAERGDGTWTVTVADDGPGVPESQRKRIFEIFARAQPGESVEGSGLGLAVCQTIVERHGGRIWVEPRPERGSAFRFTLPDRLADAGR